MLSSIVFIPRWARAVQFGWYLSKRNGLACVTPPKKFECSRWTSEYQMVIVAGQLTHVPTYFWDNNVLECGSLYMAMDCSS